MIQKKKKKLVYIGKFLKMYKKRKEDKSLHIDHRVVMLESHLVHSGTLTESEGADLYILAGHEASY